MIEVNKLKLSISNKPILQDVSFKLDDGQNLIILGRSGSGKTVLIKTLMGIFKPDEGSITIDGTDMHNGNKQRHSAIQHDFAMVFQNAALLDSFTVFQNVALPLYERGKIDYTTALEKVKKSLSVVGLEATLDKYPSELSGGMRKRIGIARALVYEPKYIIFDEPVSGLDPITASEVLFYIRHIINSVQATTITITHDIRQLEEIGDQILFLDEGRALFYGTHEKMAKCTNTLLRQFLDAGI